MKSVAFLRRRGWGEEVVDVFFLGGEGRVIDDDDDDGDDDLF